MAGKKGTFLLSLDTELAWGGFDLGLTKRYRDDYENTRACISRLLDLLEKYQIKATFALVGHLMLESCCPVDGVKHPDIVRPHYSWFQEDWFVEDPATNIMVDPIWYGIDILQQIREARPEHEIASHSFCHVIYGEKGCSQACAKSDLVACVQAGKSHGLDLTTFIFPRNSIGHRDLLVEYGFSVYRGKGTEWYHSFRSHRFRQICHLMDEFLQISPSTSSPRLDEHGLCNLEGNMLYLSRSGMRRLIPISCRVGKAIKGIDRAVERGEVFHLWLHPYNLASDPDGLLSGLGQIFAYVRRKVDRDELSNCSMGELGQRFLKDGS